MWHDPRTRRNASPPQVANNVAPGTTGSDGGEAASPVDAELQRLGAMLRQRTPTFDAALDLRVMGAIRRAPRWYTRAALAWWLRPRSLSVSPFAGLVAASAVAALLLVVMRHAPVPSVGAADSTTAMPVSAVSATSSAQVVRFVLAVPGASQVNLVGDFNEWNTTATPLRAVNAAGVWTVDVPLTPGRHEYAFVIDGREWRPDPTAPRAPANEYGPPNSVITVEAHSS